MSQNQTFNHIHVFEQNLEKKIEQKRNKPKEFKELNDNKNYRKTVGDLLYISTITRPDISVSINILGRRNEKLREADWHAVEKVIRYLKTIKDFKFVIDSSKPPKLTGYCDSDWAGDKSVRKSTSGHVFMLYNNVISWTC